MKRCKMFELMEYMLDEEVQVVNSIIEILKRGEESREKVIEHLRILQGELKALKTMCEWIASHVEVEESKSGENKSNT